MYVKFPRKKVTEGIILPTYWEDPLNPRFDNLSEANRQAIDSLDSPDCERYAGVFINGGISSNGSIPNYTDKEQGSYSIARKQMEEKDE